MASRFKTINRGLIVAAVILSAVFGSFPVHAASGAPQIMNYQGYLADDSGNPITGSKTMSFRIYATIDAAQSAALWQSGNVTVQVTNGQFSVNLGESPQTAFPATLFTDDSRFLGITVDETELTPRKRLVSVPYALNSPVAVPAGVIVMWWGDVDKIPDGWALCDGKDLDQDGTADTPDLSDRFIIAAGKTHQHRTAGGTATANFSHSHSISAQSPQTDTQGAHQHRTGIGWGSGHLFAIYSGATHPIHGAVAHGSIYQGFESGLFSTRTADAIEALTASEGGHSHRVNEHNHGGTTGTADKTLNLEPPYYVLCFIMKLQDQNL